MEENETHRKRKIELILSIRVNAFAYQPKWLHEFPNDKILVNHVTWRNGRHYHWITSTKCNQLSKFIVATIYLFRKFPIFFKRFHIYSHQQICTSIEWMHEYALELFKCVAHVEHRDWHFDGLCCLSLRYS